MVGDFASKNELPYTILLNGSRVFEQRYHGRGVPVSYLIDRSGSIAEAHVGWGEGDERILATWVQRQFR